MSDVEVVVVIVSYKSAQLAIDCLTYLEAERRLGEISIGCVIIDNASGDAMAISAAIGANGWSEWATLIEA